MVNPTKLISLSLLLMAMGLFLQAQVVVNEYSASNINTITDNYGKHEDWIELYNQGTASVDLGGYYLSDKINQPGKWQFPSGVTIAAQGFLKIWASGRDEVSGGHYHTNFKFQQTKPPVEHIVFSDPFGAIIDSIQLELTLKGHSRGRVTDGGNVWGIFTQPTPGTTNNNAADYPRYTLKPSFSQPAGFYPGPITVEIIPNEPNAIMYYTTDGADPTSSSTVYSGPVNISTTTILKAISVSTDPTVLTGLMEFATYFINVDHSVVVLSMASSNLDELLNGNSGLIPWGTFEFFNKDKVLTTRGYGEFNKHGNDSWVHPQRSIDYITRDECGYNYAICERIFQITDRDEFQRVILRAEGDDNYPGIDTSAHTRDYIVQSLARHVGASLDVRDPVRCVIYVNGQYWGVYSIRQKVDDHDYTDYMYHQGKYDLQFNMTWGSTWAEYGGQQSLDDWHTLYNYIMSHDLSIQEYYDHVDSLYDVTSIADYVIFNSWVVCSDWLNWNVGWWRGLNPEGTHRKWGYILWDEDATFGHYINYTGIPAQSPYVSPCFPEYILSSWQDPEGHIKVLNKLRGNPGFERYYVSRYIDLLNTGFSLDHMLNWVDSIVAIAEPEMPRHFTRWGGNMLEWQANIQKVRNFITARYDTAWSGLANCYGLSGPYNIRVTVEPPMAGNIQLNSLPLSQFPWDARYFGGRDIKLTALETNSAFEFDHWLLNNHVVSPSDTALDVTLSLSMGDTLRAVFIQKYVTDSLVINEINYNSAVNFDPGDWVEFYNPHDYALNIGDWVFKDEDDLHTFPFPAGTTLQPKDYLVLCEDTTQFGALFPDVDKVIGNMNFGLSGGGELIRLYNAAGLLVDTVHYDDKSPWPPEPDGNGPTLELIKPDLDNALPESWMASITYHGTPGEMNSLMVNVNPVSLMKTTFEVFPNPVTATAIISIGSDLPVRNGTLEVYNLLGKKVWELKQINNSKIYFTRDGLDKGLYLCRFSDPETGIAVTGKLVVE
jgi:hypothetical protein